MNQKGKSYFNFIPTSFPNGYFLSYYNVTVPEWFKKSEPKSQAGQNKGLKLVLDAHSDMISPGTVFDDFKGFVTVVGAKSNFPITKRQSFLLKAGQENYVSMSAINVISDEAIRSDIKFVCFRHRAAKSRFEVCAVSGVSLLFIQTPKSFFWVNMGDFGRSRCPNNQLS